MTTTEGAAARARGASDGGPSWLVSHAVEIAFMVFVVAAFAYSLRLTRSYYFFADEWLLVKQGSTLGGWFRPYNFQMGVTIIGAYRVLAGLFGFDFTPFRVVGLVGLFAVPAAYFLTTRRQLGGLLAALLALPLVWYGRYVSLNPNQVDHFLALLGGIGCAAALNRGRRADWVLAGSLAFSLCSGGAGVAVAAACVVHNLCTRAALRRWLAVLVPTLLWILWWLVEIGEVSRGPHRTAAQAVRFVRDLAYTPFDTTALGVGVLAMVLVVAFVAYAIWVLSKGLDAGANVLAWSIGVAVWAFGLVNGRPVAADVSVFRYRYIALGFILLAVVPRRPIVWPARFPIDRDRRFLVAGAVVVLALGAVRGLAVRDDMRTTSELQTNIGRGSRAETLVIGLGPSVVPDPTVLSFTFGGLRARELRALFADYGRPFPPGRAAADEQLVDMGVANAFSDGTRSGNCTPLTRPFAFRGPGIVPSVSLWSPDAPVTVEVRRFGQRWVPLYRGRPGGAVRVVLPGLGVDTPWRVRAHGACRVAARSR